MTSDRGHHRDRHRRGRDTPKPPTAQSVVDKVADKVSAKAEKLERIAAKATKKADTLDRIAAKASLKADALDRFSSGLGALDLWTRAEPAARRPRFTREEITATATRIADTEGFDALSMRRLAVELDAGTMTLYHYVRTKDELLTLVVDSVMGELLLGPDEPMPAAWRDAMTLIADKTRASLLRHPWILDVSDAPAVGPNSVRHFDQSLEAVASLPISLRDRFDIVKTVDEYVFGSCFADRHGADDHDGAHHRAHEEMIAYVNVLVETGDYPQLGALIEEFGLDEAWLEIERLQRDPERFDRNLRRLLDGIEANLPDLGPPT